MSNPYTGLGFLGTFVYPALSLFLIPVLALLIGSHSQDRFEQNLISNFEYRIQKTSGLNQHQKNRFITQVHQASIWSLVNRQEKDLYRWAELVGPFTMPTYVMYRCIYWISWTSIALGLGTLLIAGRGTVLSQSSRLAQYYSLLATWHMTGIVGVVELTLQSLLLMGLVTAEVCHHSGYAGAKILVFILGAGLTGLGMAIAAMFKHIDNRIEVSGIPIDRCHSPRFWEALDRLCGKMGTAAPDQVIAGIDDGFWVTQFPITIQEDEVMRRTYRGRTLYVSLPLLKKLPRREADGILCHEMAHFSGNDTFYSLKIAPMLERHEAYVQSLGQSWITLPVFHFASLLLVINHLSFSSMKRQREYRADRLAAEHTSADDFAFGLLRAVAFSVYRQQCESDVITADTAYEQVGIARSLDEGFRPFTETYFDEHPIDELTTLHPIDKHPPIHARLEAIGYSASRETLRQAFADDSIGPWYERINDAETLETSLWSEFEEAFREFHERLLVHQYLPSNEHERRLVEKSFPPREIPVSYGRVLRLDYEKIGFQDWNHDVYYHEIEALNVVRNDKVWIEVIYQRAGIHLNAKIPLSGMAYEEALVREMLENYSNRSDFAHAYQKERQAALAAKSEETNTGQELAFTLDSKC
ncbi:M48 family metallopeptidase [Bremerella alba]|uniref:Protease HtpX n=1 Tax=Bremerella alba TaxID=980252 RepID=A0A7V8V129_9BACT|nr:M48 family metallopeptidase [Bremerella alba]MBA2112990.1 Protease HtpX [Bremerella alba]